MGLQFAKSFLSPFIYGRYDCCSISNTHGVSLSPEVINIQEDRSQFTWKVLTKFCCKATITWRFIISEFIYFMISSKDISASQILKCSLDIFFVNSFLNKFSSRSCGSPLGVEFFYFYFYFLFFSDLRMSLGLLEYFDLLSSVYNSNIV